MLLLLVLTTLVLADLSKEVAKVDLSKPVSTVSGGTTVSVQKLPDQPGVEVVVMGDKADNLLKSSKADINVANDKVNVRPLARVDENGVVSTGVAIDVRANNGNVGKAATIEDGSLRANVGDSTVLVTQDYQPGRINSGVEVDVLGNKADTRERKEVDLKLGTQWTSIHDVMRKVDGELKAGLSIEVDRQRTADERVRPLGPNEVSTDKVIESKIGGTTMEVEKIREVNAQTQETVSGLRVEVLGEQAKALGDRMISTNVAGDKVEVKPLKKELPNGEATTGVEVDILAPGPDNVSHRATVENGHLLARVGKSEIDIAPQVKAGRIDAGVEVSVLAKDQYTSDRTPVELKNHGIAGQEVDVRNVVKEEHGGVFRAGVAIDVDRQRSRVQSASKAVLRSEYQQAAAASLSDTPASIPGDALAADTTDPELAFVDNVLGAGSRRRRSRRGLNFRKYKSAAYRKMAQLLRSRNSAKDY